MELTALIEQNLLTPPIFGFLYGTKQKLNCLYRVPYRKNDGKRLDLTRSPRTLNPVERFLEAIGFYKKRNWLCSQTLN